MNVFSDRRTQPIDVLTQVVARILVDTTTSVSICAYTKTMCQHRRHSRICGAVFPHVFILPSVFHLTDTSRVTSLGLKGVIVPASGIRLAVFLRLVGR